jgi:hypothetical protein
VYNLARHLENQIVSQNASHHFFPPHDTLRVPTHGCQDVTLVAI